jgi:hypothetical protein
MHWALWRVNITTSELLLQAQLSRQSKEVEEQRRRLPTPQYPGLKWFWNASNIFKHLKKAILRILWYTLMTQSFYIIRSLLKLPGRGNMALAKAKPLPWPRSDLVTNLQNCQAQPRGTHVEVVKWSTKLSIPKWVDVCMILHELFGDLTFGGGPKSSLLSIEHEATPHKRTPKSRAAHS